MGTFCYTDNLSTLFAFSVALAVAGVIVDGVLLHDNNVGGEISATPDSLAAFTGPGSVKLL